jgi:hypothetical protein
MPTKTLKIVVTREVCIDYCNAKYCSNDCDFMVIATTDQGHAGSCALFDDATLTWNPKKQAHGYWRCEACKQAKVVGVIF